MRAERLCVKKSGAPEKGEDDDDDDEAGEDEEDAGGIVDADTNLLNAFPLEMHPRAIREKS